MRQEQYKRFWIFLPEERAVGDNLQDNNQQRVIA
jgi:hypothetical protein